MALTFYDAKVAPSPRRIRIMLALKGVDHDVVDIDMMQAEQMGDAFRAINPDCTLPVLILEDGTKLTNVAGISAWLEAEFPDTPLTGTTAMEKADIAGWQSKLEQELLSAIPNALRNTNPVFKDRALPGPVPYAQIPELEARGLKMIDTVMQTLDDHLKGRDYIAADQLSVADITAVCGLDFARVVRKTIPDDLKHLKRWRDMLNGIAAFTL